MNPILDLPKLRNALVSTEYFPYCSVDCIVNKESLPDVLNDFPPIKVRGSVPPRCLSYGPHFQQLLDEMRGDEFRSIIAEKFQIDLSNTETMITIRGQVSLRDGYIHTDTSSKLMTVLLYLNDQWSESTGNLRLLKNGENLEDYFEEVAPTAGKLLVFKVTDNCWHGHYPFVGKRLTIQLNYVVNQDVVTRETKRHSRSYRLKKVLNFLKA